MPNENSISLFPQKRIKSYDGMPVTADIWEDAHSYHRLSAHTHNLFFHGEGVLMGLDVVASDPADHIIFVTPGVAVDETGQPIVLSEPVAYDLGDEVDGPLYLIISHRESAPGAEKTIKKGLPLWVNDEFLLLARAEIPEGNWVELARFNREDRHAPIKDAAAPQHPKKNEIDLRYRHTIRMQSEKILTAAVSYLGKSSEKSSGQGLANLAREMRLSYNVRLVVEDDLQVAPELLGYDLVLLVAEGKFSLNKTQVGGLKGYVAHGGVLIMEARDAEAATQLEDLAVQVGTAVKPLVKNSNLLCNPFLFAAPPAGYKEKGEVKSSDGVLLDTFNYSRLWNGEADGHVPTRQEIRTAMEWGINILNYVLERSESQV